MLGGIGVQEIVIILIVGLLVFGAARLPKIARSLGQGIKEFKKTVKGLDEDDEPAQKDTRYVQQPPPYPQQYPPAGGQAQQQYGPQGGRALRIRVPYRVSSPRRGSTAQELPVQARRTRREVPLPAQKMVKGSRHKP